jgi:uncharacterized protein with PIN domain
VNEKMPSRAVLDTYALVAYWAGEEHAEPVRQLLSSGEPWMTLVNLGEATYVVERRHDRSAADRLWAHMLSEYRPGGAPLRWLPVDETLVRRAASLKVLGGMSYADCFAAAAAAILQCPVLTGDPEFAVAEQAGIAVSWL